MRKDEFKLPIRAFIIAIMGFVTLGFVWSEKAPASELGAASGGQVKSALSAAAMSWSFEAYRQALAESGRNLGSYSERDFLAAQARKLKAIEEIRGYLERHFGTADESVLEAFRQVPREYFMYDYGRGRNMAGSAYQLPVGELAIGYGSTLSDFLVQAYMTQALKPKPTDVALEVGTGSGFQSSLLSRIVKEQYSIEIITNLGNKVQNVFKPLGYDNIHTRVGDGYYGWPEVNDGFDIIIVTAASPFVPPLLLQQLKKGGRMIIPIGQPWRRQFLYFFTKDDQGKIHSRKDISVLFIPMTGKVTGAQPR